MWFLCITEPADMNITGMTDIIMTGGAGDMIVTGTAGTTMTGEEADTTTGTDMACINRF